MDIGTATAAPGTVSTGYLDVTDLPTGGSERLPVLVAAGQRDGPTLWLTGGVHGDEATGIAVAQDAIHEPLPEHLAGTVVSVPVVNPAGVRRTQRTSYYHDEDPNRNFPGADDDPQRPPKVQSLVDSRLFDVMTDSADAVLDLHTAGVRSHPFTIVDRVLYGDERTAEDAAALADECDRLADAVGLPAVLEYEPEEYREYEFDKSNAGAVLNTAGVPALTFELGSPDVVEDDRYRAGLSGCYRVMAELGMVDDPAVALPEEASLADPTPSPVEFPVRRHVGPHTDEAGLVRHRVRAGDVVEHGDPVADVVGPTGEQRTTVTADHDGWILQRAHGFAVYENDPVATMAVREDDPDRVGER